MKHIHSNIYVGTKEEYGTAVESGMKIVCAMQRAKDFPSHQTKVGWEGRGCDPGHPHYLYFQEEDGIYLNFIDGNNPDYVKDKMIDAAISFIDASVAKKEQVFIYCSLGESRSPSLALIWMLRSGMLSPDKEAPDIFKKTFYPEYNPGDGIRLYIEKMLRDGEW